MTRDESFASLCEKYADKIPLAEAIAWAEANGVASVMQIGAYGVPFWRPEKKK